MKPIIVVFTALFCTGMANAGSIISASEAKEHIGEDDIGVSGYATQVVEKPGSVLVNFDGRYPYQKFAAFIPQNKVDQAGGIDFLRALPGKFVTIAGKITGKNGKAQIVVGQKKQFLVAQR
jgi:hypothetical protein